MHRSKRIAPVLGALLLVWGCSFSTGPDGPPPPETVEVSGELWIDADPAPAGIVELKLYPRGRDPEPDERIPMCRVGKDGKFQFSSYRDGDGAEPGEYVLSVEMLKMGGPGELFGPDKLGNNFNSPFTEDPRFHVDVVGDKPVRIPLILIDTTELETKPPHKYSSRAGKR